MKHNKLPNHILILLTMILVSGCAGCQKSDSDTSISGPTNALTPATSIAPTKEAVITPEQTIQPITTLTPKPVIFPVEINETTFPEPLLQKKAFAADSNQDGILSKEEADTVTKLHLKKLTDADAKDAMEDEPLPEYTPEDFTFNFEGIQYFTELSELTVNLLGGEAFVTENTDEILVTTTNFNRIYECSKLKKLSLYEVDIPSLELSAFSNLKRLELNDMYHLETLHTGNHEKLYALWISECHKLETVDLSGLKNLKTADIVLNDSIKEIIFGKANKKLENIQLNGLESLYQIDLSGLESLKSLNLTKVALKDLDVSKNEALEQLCAEGLSLKTLDLSSNLKISYLINANDSFQSILLPETNCVSMIRWTNSVVTEFPVKNLNPETLTGIDIQGTAIKELDVSAYPNLVHLYYDENLTQIKR